MSKEEFSSLHMEIVEDMISESLEKAAKSMEQMLKIRVKPKITGLGVGDLREIKEFDELGRFKVNLMKVSKNEVYR